MDSTTERYAQELYNLLINATTTDALQQEIRILARIASRYAGHKGETMCPEMSTLLGDTRKIQGQVTLPFEALRQRKPVAAVALPKTPSRQSAEGRE